MDDMQACIDSKASVDANPEINGVVCVIESSLCDVIPPSEKPNSLGNDQGKSLLKSCLTYIDKTSTNKDINIECPVLFNEEPVSDFFLDTFRSENFDYISSFCIEKRMRNISISCVRVHHKYGYVIMGELSQQKLVIYYKNGQKIDEIRLGYRPQSLCLVDDDTVAVATPQVVLIINLVSKRKTHFSLNDNCHGIACTDTMRLVVNCLNRGLVITNLKGDILEIFPSVRGKLVLCNFMWETVVYVRKCSDNKVHFLDLTLDKTTIITCRGLCEAGGLTCDDCYNVLVSCARNNRLFSINRGCTTPNEVHLRTQNPKINWFSSLDYHTETNELCLITNNAHSLCVFAGKKTV
ncbi:uncharacterized protein LOC134696881 [Mytilus trossulus]|uniref:uncharacterized protein LOC134696881 n=1 Tax=Mytilus trossulus TaxID=6551 RepID=UPI003005547D